MMKFTCDQRGLCVQLIKMPCSVNDAFHSLSPDSSWDVSITTSTVCGEGKTAVFPVSVIVLMVNYTRNEHEMALEGPSNPKPPYNIA